MTSTVLDVTVMLLCVSASVVALGGVGGTGNEVDIRGPTADEVADQLATETVTVRYRAPEAANGSRAVHATRVELIALLLSGAGGSESGLETVEARNGADVTAFESQARDAILSGIDGQTRVDARIQTTTNGNGAVSGATIDRRVSDNRDGWQAAGPVAVSGATNARRTGVGNDGDSRRRSADRSASKHRGTVVVGAEPPRSADVTTAVVTHPLPDETGVDGGVRIIVRRW